MLTMSEWIHQLIEIGSGSGEKCQDKERSGNITQINNWVRSSTMEEDEGVGLWEYGAIK